MHAPMNHIYYRNLIILGHQISEIPLYTITRWMSIPSRLSPSPISQFSRAYYGTEINTHLRFIISPRLKNWGKFFLILVPETGTVHSRLLNHFLMLVLFTRQALQLLKGILKSKKPSSSQYKTMSVEKSFFLAAKTREDTRKGERKKKSDVVFSSLQIDRWLREGGRKGTGES